MKKSPFFVLFALLALAACVNDAPLAPGKNGPNQALLSIITEDDPRWRHENLRLYPVLASPELTGSNDRLNHLKTLSEGMQIPGFRIMEQKQFGRSNDAWQHSLTVQNKTQDTVLLLSGDVVKGGNQDRVIAHHEVIMPMTVRNIEVFCVEAGRSSYYDPSAPAAEKEAAAFKGYYNVASPKVRRAVQNTGNQQAVWDAVAKVTKANKAESATQAYTALDYQSEEKVRRDAYLLQLQDAFARLGNVVGVVAVSGDQVLGVDIFGSPDLFRRHYPALLHGYVAEAAAGKPSAQALENQVFDAFDKVSRLTPPQAAGNEAAGKFAWQGAWVHLYSK